MARDFQGLEHAAGADARGRRAVQRSSSRSAASCCPRTRCREGRDAFDYLVELCEHGLARRYGAATPELTERLRFELKTVREMGFADYFLIVWDFIHFAKQNGVSVGPGRGSAAGSLAAYCLEITDVDPMRYGLLFERFLNPARKDLPDMDIDFSVAGRDRVINYVAEKYGRDRVAQIITFSTMAARAAIRDAGRVLDVPYGVVDRIAQDGPGRARADARGGPEAGCRAASGGRLGPRREGGRRARAAARRADAGGLDPRGGRGHRGAAADRGRAAAAEGRRPGGGDAGRDARRRRARPPEDGLPRPAQPGRHRQGRRARRRRGHRHAPARRPEDVRDARARGVDGRLPVRVVGHARGAAPRQAERVRGPDRARRALPRPGPMAYISTYAARKHGREQVSFADARLEAITGGTYAICIYQEQYMQIAKGARGVLPAEAETLRKAIGKKIHALMASLKGKFLEGCAENQVAPSVAQQLWKDMESSQDYSFNKAHAACYALIAYRTAWLKANHPREYMAALISSVMNTKDRVPFYVNACREMGIDVLPPDVNSSRQDFAVVGGVIHFGLNAVKNVGEAAAEAIVSARCGGRAVRLDLGVHRARRSQLLNKRALESLVRAARSTRPGRRGWGCSRRRSSTRRGATASALAADRLAGRLRSSTTPRGGREPVEDAAPDDLRDGVRRARAATSREGDARDLYVSEHPLERVRAELRRKTDCVLMDVERRRDGDIVTVGGIVSGLKQVTTKRGEPMVFVALDDPTGSVGGRRLQLDVRRRPRAPRARPHPRRQGARRPQAGRRDEARRPRGRARSSGRRATRGAPAHRRAPGTRRAHPRARGARLRLSGRRARSTSRSTPRSASARSRSAPSIG